MGGNSSMRESRRGGERDTGIKKTMGVENVRNWKTEQKGCGTLPWKLQDQDGNSWSDVSTVDPKGLLGRFTIQRSGLQALNILWGRETYGINFGIGGSGTELPDRRKTV